MVKHCPEVDWRKQEILGWSPVCSTRCLQKAHSPAAVPRLEAAPNLAMVPVEYHHLSEVFCKSRATCLPPHRPYDCGIDPKPGTTPRRGRLFSLSRPETEAMEKYIGKSLAAGIIRPHHPLERDSSSSARRTDLCTPISTTEELTTSQSRTGMLSPWW